MMMHDSYIYQIDHVSSFSQIGKHTCDMQYYKSLQHLIKTTTHTKVSQTTQVRTRMHHMLTCKATCSKQPVASGVETIGST